MSNDGNGESDPDDVGTLRKMEGEVEKHILLVQIEESFLQDLREIVDAYDNHTLEFEVTRPQDVNSKLHVAIEITGTIREMELLKAVLEDAGVEVISIGEENS